MAFLIVYPKPALSRCNTMFTYTDLFFFLNQASQLGYYEGFSWDLEELTNGFYNVSVPGAAEFYHEFMIGNITNNFNEFPGLELSDPQQRVQICTDPIGNPIDGNNREDVVPIPDRDYEEFNVDEYYVCY